MRGEWAFDKKKPSYIYPYSPSRYNYFITEGKSLSVLSRLQGHGKKKKQFRKVREIFSEIPRSDGETLKNNVVGLVRKKSLDSLF